MLSQANSIRIPLKGNSVHCCITSPPYFNLRSYLPDDDPLKAYEIGNESTPEQYIANLVAVGREVWRVLRGDGFFWLNLGEKSASRGGKRTYGSYDGKTGRRDAPGDRAKANGVKPKNILGIPWRVALALQADGWILRMACPWVKASGMPESVTDRPNVAHETVFLLSKSPRYYFDMDAVRVGYSNIQSGNAATFKRNGSKRETPINGQVYGTHRPDREDESTYENVGRHWRTSDIFNAGLDDTLLALEAQKARLEAEIAALKYARNNGGLAAYGDDPLAFLVNTRPYKGAHCAVFPPALVVPMIKASTSPKVCGACGAPYVRLTEKVKAKTTNPRPFSKAGNGNRNDTLRVYEERESIMLGWRTTCSCDAPTMPAIVLDPFVGSGTVGAACRELGREFIGLDLNAKYLAENAMARSERTTSAAVLAQMPLFAGMETK